MRAARAAATYGIHSVNGGETMLVGGSDGPLRLAERMVREEAESAARENEYLHPRDRTEAIVLTDRTGQNELYRVRVKGGRS